MGITKRYSNGEITVVWQPDRCAHSTLCFQGLPTVFDPRERPWVRIGGAPTDAIVRQVEACPSGALSWEPVAAAPVAAPSAAAQPAPPLRVPITARPNGPLVVHGTLAVTLPDGTVVERPKVASFCRCGHSANKPFCDGSHARVGFVG
ncbi:MAG: (4Fe-4S)-binding protein [Vicinamibacterales bacterium]